MTSKATTRRRGATRLLETWRASHSHVLARQDFADAICLSRAKGVRDKSIHRDGEIITRVLRRFGVSAVRGSSHPRVGGRTQRDARSLSAGPRFIRRPRRPPGPSIPRQIRKCLQLARATGAPIFPATYSAAWKTTVRSWDRLLIPLPFSQVLYVVGSPIHVPRDATNEVIEAKRQELEAALMRITTQADDYFFRSSPRSRQARRVLTQPRSHSRRDELLRNGWTRPAAFTSR